MAISENLKKKYNPFKNSRPKLKKPEDSIAVMRLFEYLGSNEGQGIEIVEIEGNPAISFKPGLKITDGPQRWEIANHAEYLFFRALQDLRELMNIGGIRLKQKR